ncbi:MAG: hypothetical protein QGH12_06255, partial [SAR324 cluster bacterium]|nr:hypothetical protein [SAR324 cluster bacterium]
MGFSLVATAPRNPGKKGELLLQERYCFGRTIRWLDRIGIVSSTNMGSQQEETKSYEKTFHSMPDQVLASYL